MINPDQTSELYHFWYILARGVFFTPIFHTIHKEMI
nr:MAG TPA: hypothetical protein [Caudoviricetes sp.]